MSANRSLSILARPLGRPWLGRCPQCKRWFVFWPVEKRGDSHSKTVLTCRCRRCGHEESFADRHPPHVV